MLWHSNINFEGHLFGFARFSLVFVTKSNLIFSEKVT